MTELAYLDPGTGSLLLQALVGGAAGLWVFARYVWQTFIIRRATPVKTPVDLPSAENRSVQ